MAENSGLSGNVRTIATIIMLSAAVAGWAWGAGRGAVQDTVMANTDSIASNTDTVRALEVKCATFATDLDNIKKQLDKQDDKLDAILSRLPR